MDRKRRRTAIVAALAVVSAIALFARLAGDRSRDAWSRARGERASAVSLDPGDGEPRQGLLARAAAHPVEEPAPEPAEEVRAPRPGVARITGVVLLDGAPASGAVVRAMDASAGRSATARSGKDGRFELELESSEYVQVDALKDEHLRGAALVFAGARPIEPVRIELKRAGVVLVTVSGPRDHGRVKGARVACGLSGGALGDDEPLDHRRDLGGIAEKTFGPVETDAEGRARLFVVRGGKYEIEAEHDELGVVVGVFSLEVRDTPQEIALELRGGSTILGRVIDESRAPVAAVDVWLSPSRSGQTFGHRRATTDASGQFRIAGVEAGHFTIGARSPVHLPITRELEKKDDINDVAVELLVVRGQTIEGRVLDANDAPLPGWRVLALPDSAEAEPRRATSREDGAFVVEGCAQGVSYTFSVARPGTTETGAFLDGRRAVRAKAGDRDVILRGGAGATLAGEVRFEGRDPPASYTITIDGRPYPQHGAGAFRVEGLPGGGVEVVATAPGFAAEAKEVELEEGETESVSFSLEPELAVAGRVVDLKTGEPIAGALVLVLADDDEVRDGVASVRTGGDGGFRLAGLSSGSLRLSVRAASYAPSLVGPLEMSAESPPIVVRLGRGVRLSGRVHSGGVAPRGGLVTSLPLAEAAGESRWSSREAELEPDGTYALEGVTPGKIVLRAQASFGEGARSKELTLELPPAGLEGLDLDFGGIGARLIVSLPPSADSSTYLWLSRGHLDRSARWPERAKSSESRVVRAGLGEVVFEGLESGDYTLWAWSSGSSAAEEIAAEPSPLHITIHEGDEIARVAVPPR